MKFMNTVLTVLLISFSGLSNAGLITFDDLPGLSVQNGVSNLNTPIQGFNFSSTLDVLDLVGSTWNYGSHSGEFGILNNNGGIGSVTSADGSDFTFDGLWAKRWSSPINSGGAIVQPGTLQGFKDDILVWSVNVGLNGSYRHFEAQSGAIDRLAIGFGGIFLVDDLALNMPVSSEVPEPSTLAIFALGIMVLASRRFKKKS